MFNAEGFNAEGFNDEGFNDEVAEAAEPSKAV